ncbi:hypothetical protein TNCV_1800121 [Trichonephila clavipes]|nr:hypothetical protein TNCV_1800121 [Trichonephila clavipes]
MFPLLCRDRLRMVFMEVDSGGKDNELNAIRLKAILILFRSWSRRHFHSVVCIHPLPPSKDKSRRFSHLSDDSTFVARKVLYIGCVKGIHSSLFDLGNSTPSSGELTVTVTHESRLLIRNLLGLKSTLIRGLSGIADSQTRCRYRFVRKRKPIVPTGVAFNFRTGMGKKVKITQTYLSRDDVGHEFVSEVPRVQVMVPLKICRVEEDEASQIFRFAVSSYWCSVVIRRRECQLRCRPRHLIEAQNYEVRLQ